MAFFNSRAVRTLIEPMIKPMLQKHGIDLSALQSPAQKRSVKNVFGMKKTHHKEDGMGALLKFILVNAVSVIGAKLISEASDRFSQKMFNSKKDSLANDPDHPDAKTLDTRVCPKCGAFRIRGETCACGAR